jgi:hypothetical protein
METSLHRQLKRLYGGSHAQYEAQVGRYRIDVRSGGQLVEIQHGTLAAIRDKIRALVEHHEVLVVKPIIAHKLLVRLAAKGGPPIARRTSPKQGKLLDLFADLVHFTNVFPHPRLTLEVPLVEVEEQRYPGHGRRRRWSRADFEVLDQRLLSIVEVHRFHTAQDLLRLIPGPLPSPFDTGDLARLLNIPRRRAQQVAYCLDRMGAACRVGKRGNARLYELSTRPRPTRRRRAS